MPDTIDGLHHVGIIVQNLENSAAWYAEALGFVRGETMKFPGATAEFILRGSLRLELVEAEGATPVAPERKNPKTNMQQGGMNHIAIAVDDLGKEVEFLRARGVEIVVPPTEVPDTGGDRFAFIHDNEGVLLELYETKR